MGAAAISSAFTPGPIDRPAKIEGAALDMPWASKGLESTGHSRFAIA